MRSGELMVWRPKSLVSVLLACDLTDGCILVAEKEVADLTVNAMQKMVKKIVDPTLLDRSIRAFSDLVLSSIECMTKAMNFSVSIVRRHRFPITDVDAVGRRSPLVEDPGTLSCISRGIQ